jgi:putative membrane protein
MRIVLTGLVVATLAISWLGSLPALARESFAMHMMLHIVLVAIAAPLLALAIAGTAADPVRRMPRLWAAIPASMVELVVVWAWHVPALHEAARHHAAVFAAEQATFILSGAFLWTAAVGGSSTQRRLRAGGGVVALLFTSMHMTLLGALFALTNRPLFAHAASGSAAAAVADQQLGGVIMLLVGGTSYLLGGLGLTAIALRSASASEEAV